MEMIRCSLGVTRKGNIRNEHTRGTLEIDMFEQKLTQSRRIWSGHVKRRDDDYVGTKVLEMQLSGKRKRGRQNMMYLYVLKEDMQEVGAREDEVVGCGEGGHAGGRSERRLSVWMC